jgi:hypothetical protein
LSPRMRGMTRTLIHPLNSSRAGNLAVSKIPLDSVGLEGLTIC